MIPGAGLIFLLACAAAQLPKDLTPEEKEFISNVRYIISGQERRAFLGLPASERARFIEEFWRSRDPDPTTEVNEYKVEYLKRIGEAKHLFTEGGASGWLTDRGRVYIMLGPPEQRETYPQGYFNFRWPVEVWHYGFYEIYFVDSRFNGNFELVAESARLISEINVAQQQLRPRPGGGEEKSAAEFNVDVQKTPQGGRTIIVTIPYEDIWFSAEGKEFKASFELSFEVYDAADKVINKGSETYPLSLTQDELRGLRGKDWRAEITLDLGPGDYEVALTMKNLTDQREVRKRIKFTV
jgi:GWxTD domain-containing protein